MISFSALDNLRDLTCVSLLAVSVEGVTARFHCGKQVCIVDSGLLKNIDFELIIMIRWYETGNNHLSMTSNSHTLAKIEFCIPFCVAYRPSTSVKY